GGHVPWQGPRFLAEDFKQHDCILRDVIDDAPCGAAVYDSELVTTRADLGKRPRSRHSEQLSILQTSKQETCFDACRARKRRRLDLATQPDERLRHANRDSLRRNRHMRKPGASS